MSATNPFALTQNLQRFGHRAFMAWLIASLVVGAAAALLAFSQSMIALVAAMESAWI